MAGGLYDQPAGMMKKLRMVMNVYHAFKLYHQQGTKAGGVAKWKREHEDVWNIVMDINEMRANYG